MTAGDGYLAVIAVRPRPASKRRRHFRPALGRTATLPSVPVRGDPGRTGRLTSLHVSTAQRLPVLHSDAAVVTAAILTQPGEVLIENPFDLTNISPWWGGGSTRQGGKH